MPPDGWVCFHCGERFTTVGGAQTHFGRRPIDTPGCLIKVGEERRRFRLLSVYGLSICRHTKSKRNRLN